MCQYRNEDSGSALTVRDAEPEVGHVVAQAGVLRQPVEVLPGVGHEDAAADQDHEPPELERDRQHDHRAVEEQQEARPAHGRAVRLRMHLRDRRAPLRRVHPAVRADRVHIEAPQRHQHRRAQEPEHAPHVDGAHLQQDERMQRRFLGQQDFAVAVGEERVAMVIRVAHPVLVVVPPPDDAEQAQEEAAQRRRPEHGAVHQFVRRHAGEEAGDGPVEPQRDAEHGPPALLERHRRQRPQRHDQPQVAQRLREALAVAALHQRPERRLVDRRAVPLDAQALAHLAQRLPGAGRGGGRHCRFPSRTWPAPRAGTMIAPAASGCSAGADRGRRACRRRRS